MTEEAITIWNQNHCLPQLTSILRERVSPRNSEREMRELEGQRDQLAGNRLALFWKEEEQNANCKLPPCISSSEKKRESKGRDEGGGGTGLGGGIGGREEKNFRKKKNPQQAIRLIFSQPGLWVHCLVFAGAQAVCPGGATF